jgi:hypothetical protein
VSQIFALEQLEAAVTVLSRGGSLRRRLGTAWVDHLSRIDPDKDLPGEVRQRFRALPMFGRRAFGQPEGIVAAFNEHELRVAATEIVDIRDRVRARSGR